MAQKRKSNKKGGGLKEVVIGIFIIIVLVAFVRGQGGIEGVVNWAKDKSDQVSAKYQDVIENGLPSGGGGTWTAGERKPYVPKERPAPGGGQQGNNANNETHVINVDEVYATLNTIPVKERVKGKYNRDDYKHWERITNNCSSKDVWDVRKELLYINAQPGTIVMVDGNGNETTDKNVACKVVKGEWIDPYTGKTVDNPKGIQIDHIVPLSLADDMGAHSWDAAKKQAFANDIEYNLSISGSSANRQKSDKGPGKWLPTESYRCEYVAKFVKATAKYELNISPEDKAAVEKVLASC